MVRAISICCVLFATASAFADGDTGPGIPWSDSIVDRPLTLPQGKMAIYGDFDVAKFDLGSGTTTITSTSELIHGGVGYGVTDQLTIGAEYAFNLRESSEFMGMSQSNTLPANGRGPFIPYASFRLLHGPLSVAVSGGLVVDLEGNQSVDATGTSYSTTYTIIAGAVVKYNLAPTVTVYTAGPVGGGSIGFAGGPFGPGPIGNQLEIPLSKDAGGGSAPSRIMVPVGLGIQATPELFVFGQTTLLAAYVANAPSGADNPVFIGSDSTKGGLGIPLTAGAFFALNHSLELGGTLSFPDVEHAGDLYLFGFAARLYSGK